MEGKDILMLFPSAVLIPPLAYAETHYRLKYFGSLLRKPEPEVIADAPHRIEPGHALTVLLLAKDADAHPATLMRASAVVRKGKELLGEFPLISQPVRLLEPRWWTVCTIELHGVTGWVECDVRFVLEVNGHTRGYANDNSRTSSHAPLRVYLSPSSLPTLPGLVLGEGHAHSDYTDDQVEYGAPLGAIRALGRAMGLGFSAITDHSYDLDDSPASYLVNDPAIPKWHGFQRDCDALNGTGAEPILLRGEEVTCRNSRGKNVHCLVLGDRMFHPGSGDSAERWLRTRSELSIPELLKQMTSGALAIGAHVSDPAPLLQRFLLNRDRWHAEDLLNDGLHGLQFWNGTIDDGFSAGKKAWIRTLLSGRRLTIFGGNDAHGNFNRFRQVGIPFLILRDADHQLYGRVRTGLFPASKSEPALLGALKAGRTIVTDGPVAAMTDSSGRILHGTESESPGPVVIHAVSSSEFGPLREVVLWKGIIGSDNEERVHAWNGGGSEVFVEQVDDDDLRPHYLRIEAYSSSGERDGQTHLCLTNPMWCGSASRL